ncbi:hypothetical protein BH10BDE1_BH10BDE1_20540 [soil metagenome]
MTSFSRTFTSCAFFTLGLAFSAISSAQTGFVGGNNFEYTPATGDVYVNCPRTGGGIPTGPSAASYRCYGYSFAPAESAQFAGPKLDANLVELTATRADGSTFKKTGEYLGSRGISKDTFNLWIETLFQRPLLQIGRNDVTWTLKKDGRIVMSGNFISEVYQKANLLCPNVSETSWDANDCVNSSRVCSDYFYNYGNQCR